MRLIHTPLLESPVARVLGLVATPDADDKPYVEAIAAPKVTFVRSGLFSHAHGRESMVADAGQLVFFGAREYLFSHPRGGSGNRCTVIELSPETGSELGPLFHGTHRDRVTRPQVTASTAWIQRHLELLASVAETRGAFTVSTEEITLELLRGAVSMASPHSGRSRRAESVDVRRRRFVSDARMLLHGSLREPPSLSGLARAVGCSASYLSRIFAQYSGMTIRVYLARQRAYAAAERILGGEQNLASLAMDLGLYDHAHLCRIFHRVWGMSPSTFRGRYARDKRFKSSVTNRLRHTSSTR